MDEMKKEMLEAMLAKHDIPDAVKDLLRSAAEKFAEHMEEGPDIKFVHPEHVDFEPIKDLAIGDVLEWKSANHKCANAPKLGARVYVSAVFSPQFTSYDGENDIHDFGFVHEHDDGRLCETYGDSRRFKRV